jgi:hypothetical protein
MSSEAAVISGESIALIFAEEQPPKSKETNTSRAK